MMIRTASTSSLGLRLFASSCNSKSTNSYSSSCCLFSTRTQTAIPIPYYSRRSNQLYQQQKLSKHGQQYRSRRGLFFSPSPLFCYFPICHDTTSRLCTSASVQLAVVHPCAYSRSVRTSCRTPSQSQNQMQSQQKQIRRQLSIDLSGTSFTDENHDSHSFPIFHSDSTDLSPICRNAHQYLSDLTNDTPRILSSGGTAVTSSSQSVCSTSRKKHFHTRANSPDKQNLQSESSESTTSPSFLTGLDAQVSQKDNEDILDDFITSYSKSSSSKTSGPGNVAQTNRDDAERSNYRKETKNHHKSGGHRTKVVQIHSDGACSGNNVKSSKKRRMSIGIYFGPHCPLNAGIYLPANEVKKVSSGVAELLAQIKSLEILKEQRDTYLDYIGYNPEVPTRLELVTDSNYVKLMMNDIVPKLVKGDWKDSKSYVNIPYLKKLFEASAEIPQIFQGFLPVGFKWASRDTRGLIEAHNLASAAMKLKNEHKGSVNIKLSKPTSQKTTAITKTKSTKTETTKTRKAKKTKATVDSGAVASIANGTFAELLNTPANIKSEERTTKTKKTSKTATKTKKQKASVATAADEVQDTKPTKSKKARKSTRTKSAGEDMKTLKSGTKEKQSKASKSKDLESATLKAAEKSSKSKKKATTATGEKPTKFSSKADTITTVLKTKKNESKTKKARNIADDNKSLSTEKPPKKPASKTTKKPKKSETQKRH